MHVYVCLYNLSTLVFRTCWNHVAYMHAATGTLVAIQLYLTVRHQLQPAMQLPAIDPSTMLTDKFGAWFGSFNIAICLVLLALAPALDLSMWLITLIAALLHGCYNLIAHVAFDPVAGRWLGWTMILHVWQGRWIHNKVGPTTCNKSAA